MHFINPPALRKAMWQADMTQEETAKAAGLKLSTFKSYLRLKRHVPLSAVVSIGEALKCDTYSLIGPLDPHATVRGLVKEMAMSPDEYVEWVAA